MAKKTKVKQKVLHESNGERLATAMQEHFDKGWTIVHGTLRIAHYPDRNYGTAMCVVEKELGDE